MSRDELEQHDFHGLGIAPGLLKRIKTLGFVHPTPIQYKAIPIATSGEDVVGEIIVKLYSNKYVMLR